MISYLTRAFMEMKGFMWELPRPENAVQAPFGYKGGIRMADEETGYQRDNAVFSGTIGPCGRNH